MNNKKTEKLIKQIYDTKLNVTTNDSLDKKILSSLKAAPASYVTKPIIWKPALSIAALFFLLIALRLIPLSNCKVQQDEDVTEQTFSIPQTPSELICTLSLNQAFKQGGMNAVDHQLEKAQEKVKSSLQTDLTIEQILCELDGC